LEPASEYPCLRDPLNLRAMTVPHHGFRAAPDVMWKIARLTGLPLESAVGEYQTWSGNLRGSPLRPCVNTIPSGRPSGMYASRRGIGAVPSLVETGRQSTEMILGRSGYELGQRRIQHRCTSLLTFLRRKQYGRNFNDLRLRWWRCSDHVVFSLCGKTLLAMTRPILELFVSGTTVAQKRCVTHTLEMLWRAVPGLLTAGAPHRSRSAAQRAWVINKRSAAHSVRGGV
jgi:hypothetical protein